jgi:hypothetical protein
MFMMLSGPFMMIGSVVLLKLVSFPEGQASTRPEWIDTSLAILVTTGVSVGLVSTVAGATALLTGVPF